MQTFDSMRGGWFFPGVDSYVSYEGRWTRQTTLKWIELGRPPVNFLATRHVDLDILATVDGLERLRVFGTVKDDSGLSRCTSLRALGIATSKKGRFDFTKLTELRELTFEPDRRGPGFDDLPNLELLKCSWNAPSLSGIERHRGLRELGITSRALTDLSPLAKLPRLERLSLDSVRGLTDLSALADCPALKAVAINGATHLTSVEPLAKANGLQWLHIENSPLVESFEPLKRLPDIRHISFTSVLDGNLRALTENPNLRWLGVRTVKEHHNMSRAEIDQFNQERGGND